MPPPSYIQPLKPTKFMPNGTAVKYCAAKLLPVQKYELA